jgi:hypothetical protein
MVFRPLQQLGLMFDREVSDGKMAQWFDFGIRLTHLINHWAKQAGSLTQPQRYL